MIMLQPAHSLLLQKTDVMKIVTDYLSAYEENDRQMLETLIAPDFTFTSPLDDRISRDAYFAKYWRNHENLREFDIKKIFAEGDEVFLLYVGHTKDGQHFSNTEFIRVVKGKIKSIEVFFGDHLGSPTNH
jgi:ketosteroid isomerase-like protein